MVFHHVLKSHCDAVTVFHYNCEVALGDDAWVQVDNYSGAVITGISLFLHLA